MRTQLHAPRGGTPLGERLGERLAAMSAPCPMHPSVHRIEAAVIDWARRTGLEADPTAGVHLLAGRAFARHDTGTATTFACWLTWLSRLRDEPSALAGVLAVAGGGEPGPAPVERAFADLWRACAPAMSDGWRERFVAGLAAGTAGLAPGHAKPPGTGTAGTTRTTGTTGARTAGTNRADAGTAGTRTAGTASAEERPARSGAGLGRRLSDLVEPCVGIEVPAQVGESPRWRSMVEASGDVVTWCDDLATGGGYAAAASALLGGGGVPGRAGEAGAGTTVGWAADRVADRMEELWASARALPVLVERCGLDFAASREVIQVACAFLTIPRAYLEGLLESPRYRHLE
ncbi:terpene synthase family protein [Streptosporangium carneum]|uniref:Uncharacterized protein n=1 Tax=Streptosporangium carneum TaxID=47481 RepID=A0A9W6I1C6_9ACTN|nr:terpene synthase family protein [Streptosporangium carneum]GLK10217.1 hypothetical protein GCM10017600_36230 [Streptosporangium carneum]